MVLGVAMAVAPFTSWYRADLPGRDITFQGVDVAGELWSLPVLGTLIVAMGTALLRSGATADSRFGRWAGGVVAVAGVLAFAWTLKGIFDIRALAFPNVSGPAAPISATAAGYVTAGICAVTVAAGLQWLRAGSD